MSAIELPGNDYDLGNEISVLQITATVVPGRKLQLAQEIIYK